ncbi:radical SAM protein [Streptomyces sp. NPDC059209]|uniref:radical SAM protein n=1 Tax=Streptomyces sp. NPDC059209 TaxID=3346769 RepID=UPI003688295B
MTAPFTSATAGAAVDWTALENFAALRGQLRVSLTPRCNIACYFCHNEDDVPPPLTRRDRTQQPRRREINAEDFLTGIKAMTRRGLKRVYFSGGEPLTSPLAREVLTGLEPLGPDGSYTLITNGTRVRTHRSWLATTLLDKIKVSLHYFSDESLRAIAGTRIGIDTILDGIDAAQDTVDHVELNCLLLEQNAHEVAKILDFALNRRLPVQFIELVETEFNQNQRSTAVSAETVISHLRTLTRDEHTEVAGVGQGRRVFRVDGVEIDVIHRNLGRHHVGQCGTCPLRSQCVEGFWALRFDHAGGIQPCLLRSDLRLNIKDLLHDPDRLAEGVAGHISSFTEGTL